MKFIYFAGNGKEFNNLAWDFCLHIDTRLISPIRLNLNFAQNSRQNSLENQLEIIIIIRPKESLLAFLGIRITNDFAHKDKVKWSRRGSLPSSSPSLHSKFQLQCTIANKLCKQIMQTNTTTSTSSRYGDCFLVFHTEMHLKFMQIAEQREPIFFRVNKQWRSTDNNILNCSLSRTRPFRNHIPYVRVCTTRHKATQRDAHLK